MPDVNITIRTIDEGSRNTSGLSLKFTELSSALGLVRQGLEAAREAYSQTVGELERYADQVQRISQLSGMSVEESSRLIQVADDLRVEYGALERAMTIAAKNGIDPSIEGLARLSDQYLALEAGPQRASFAADKFGKSYVDMLKLLEAGGDKIRKMAGNVEGGLIISEKDIAQLRAYQREIDNWTDKLESAKIMTGGWIVTQLNASSVYDHANKLLNEQGLAIDGLHSNYGRLTIATQAQIDAAMKQAEAEYYTAGAMEESKAAAADLEAQTKELSAANQAMLGLIGDIQSAEDDYNKTAAELGAERVKIEEEKAAAIAAGWSTGSEKIKEYDDALAENSANAQKNLDEFNRQNLEIISGLVERKLMQDGILDDKEFNWLIEKRKEWGIYSADVVEKARAAWQEADKITASIAAIPANKTTTVTTRYIEDRTSLQQSAPAYYASEHRDAGGPGQAGVSYLIGRGAQPELFTPGVAGSFTPNADRMGGGSGELIAAIQELAEAGRINEDNIKRAFRDALLEAKL